MPPIPKSLKKLMKLMNLSLKKAVFKELTTGQQIYYVVSEKEKSKFVVVKMKYNKLYLIPVLSELECGAEQIDFSNLPYSWYSNSVAFSKTERKLVIAKGNSYDEVAFATNDFFIYEGNAHKFLDKNKIPASELELEVAANITNLNSTSTRGYESSGTYSDDNTKEIRSRRSSISADSGHGSDTEDELAAISGENSNNEYESSGTYSETEDNSSYNKVGEEVIPGIWANEVIDNDNSYIVITNTNDKNNAVSTDFSNNLITENSDFNIISSDEINVVVQAEKDLKNKLGIENSAVFVDALITDINSNKKDLVPFTSLRSGQIIKVGSKSNFFVYRIDENVVALVLLYERKDLAQDDVLLFNQNYKYVYQNFLTANLDNNFTNIYFFDSNTFSQLNTSFYHKTPIKVAPKNKDVMAIIKNACQQAWKNFECCYLVPEEYAFPEGDNEHIAAPLNIINNKNYNLRGKIFKCYPNNEEMTFVIVNEEKNAKGMRQLQCVAEINDEKHSPAIQSLLYGEAHKLIGNFLPEPETIVNVEIINSIDNNNCEIEFKTGPFAGLKTNIMLQNELLPLPTVQLLTAYSNKELKTIIEEFKFKENKDRNYSAPKKFLSEIPASYFSHMTPITKSFFLQTWSNSLNITQWNSLTETNETDNISFVNNIFMFNDTLFSSASYYRKEVPLLIVEQVPTKILKKDAFGLSDALVLYGVRIVSKDINTLVYDSKDIIKIVLDQEEIAKLTNNSTANNKNFNIKKAFMGKMLFSWQNNDKQEEIISKTCSLKFVDKNNINIEKVKTETLLRTNIINDTVVQDNSDKRKHFYVNNRKLIKLSNCVNNTFYQFSKQRFCIFFANMAKMKEWIDSDVKNGILYKNIANILKVNPIDKMNGFRLCLFFDTNISSDKQMLIANDSPKLTFCNLSFYSNYDKNISPLSLSEQEQVAKLMRLSLKDDKFITNINEIITACTSDIVKTTQEIGKDIKEKFETFKNKAKNKDFFENIILPPFDENKYQWENFSWLMEKWLLSKMELWIKPFQDEINQEFNINIFLNSDDNFLNFNSNTISLTLLDNNNGFTVNDINVAIPLKWEINPQIPQLINNKITTLKDQQKNIIEDISNLNETITKRLVELLAPDSVITKYLLAIKKYKIKNVEEKVVTMTDSTIKNLEKLIQLQKSLPILAHSCQDLSPGIDDFKREFAYLHYQKMLQKYNGVGQKYQNLINKNQDLEDQVLITKGEYELVNKALVDVTAVVTALKVPNVFTRFWVRIVTFFETKILSRFKKQEPLKTDSAINDYLQKLAAINDQQTQNQNRFDLIPKTENSPNNTEQFAEKVKSINDLSDPNVELPPVQKLELNINIV